jgi:glycosyltransferase involved in cell wall biosynthesis
MRRRHPPRIALVTPWPPEWSGVGDYNRQLVAALGEHVGLDVVTAETPRSAGYQDPAGAHARLVGAPDLSAGARRRYDRIVYCMGNSRFHAHVFDLFSQQPDAVLFHDVQLTGFFGSIAGDEDPADPGAWLAARIAGMYGAYEPSATSRYMTRELQSAATQSFVHSRSALTMLERDQADGVGYAPASQLLYAFPAVDVRAGRVRADLSPAPVVVSMGAVAEVKEIASLIGAFGLIAGEHPAARLVIAGAPVADEEPTRWQDFAREHAPTATVEFPGRVSREHYDELLRGADVAVQLRRVSNGEASGATADALAAGIPTLVTDLGWAGELPPDVVSRVPAGATPPLIAEQLDELLSSREARMRHSAAALEYAQAHGFERAAREYIEALGLA